MPAREAKSSRPIDDRVEDTVMTRRDVPMAVPGQTLHAILLSF